MKRGMVLSLAAVALAAIGVCRSQAATVNVVLDVYYGDSNSDNIPNTGSAGTWQLVAYTSTGDNRGIAGLDTALSGVVNAVGPTGASFLAPNGSATVGGVAGQAGFQTTYDAKNWAQDQDANATTLDMLFGQIPLDTPNQGLFYDVGNPAAGNIKSSADQAAGQPVVTGLGSTVTWNFDDALGDYLADSNQSNNNGAAQRGVLLAFGRFNAGQSPAVVAGATAANVFTALGTQATRPANGTIQAATIAAPVVRNNTTFRMADFNLDTRVDAADIGQLFGGFDGGVADRIWQQGDASGDKRVDAADIGLLFGAFTGDPGPTPAGTVKAEYNPFTGEIKVTANAVGTWYIEALGKMTGSAAVLPAVVGALNTDNDDRIGQSTFAGTLNYENHSLGLVAGLGLTVNDFILKSSAGLGSPQIDGVVTVVPEPASIAMVGLSLVSLGLVRRRKAA